MSDTARPVNPIVPRSRVELVDTFATEHIIRIYRQQTGLDVTRHFENVPEVQLYECAETGYRFYYPFTVQGDEAFYRSLYCTEAGGATDYDRDWSEDHEFALGFLSPRDRLLEVGCGSGKFLERAAQKAGYARGLEMESFAAGLCAKKGLSVTVGSVEEYAETNRGEYDVVCSFQVLEHEADVHGFVDSLLRLLRPGGKLILSVPNSDPYYQRFNKYEVMNLPPHHVGLWRMETFRRFFGLLGVKVIGHMHFASSRLTVDAYLRSKMWTGVISLPRRHSILDKAKMLTAAPFALARSAVDYAAGNVNNAYLAVAARKET